MLIPYIQYAIGAIALVVFVHDMVAMFTSNPTDRPEHEELPPD
ncbi:hypothetical protein [Rhodococcus sp. NPDC058521]